MEASFQSLAREMIVVESLTPILAPLLTPSIAIITLFRVEYNRRNSEFIRKEPCFEYASKQGSWSVGVLPPFFMFVSN